MPKEVESGTTVTTRARFYSTFAGRCFIGFLIAFEVVLVASTIMMGVWMGVYRDGYNWDSDDPLQQFSYHPLFMFIGLVFIYGNGMLVYRMCRSCSKVPLKVVHTIIQAAALVFAGVGLAAAFDHHDRTNTEHLFSLHSWLGLIVVILFGLQWLVGLVSFLLPCVSQKFRAFLQPIHVYVGAMMFVFAVAVSYTGMTQTLMFHLGAEYQNFPPEAVFANCLALFMGLIVIFGIILVAYFQFRRVPPQDDEKK